MLPSIGKYVGGVMKNYIKLIGPWDEGYSVDYLLKNNVPEYNKDGSINKKSIRTEIGQLHYELKVLKNEAVLNEIHVIIKKLLDAWFIKIKIDTILPVPSSHNNVSKIAQLLSSKLNVTMGNNLINNQDNYEIINKDELNGQNILILDDSYKTGKTMNDIVKKIKNSANVSNIFVLTLVKSKENEKL